MSKKSYVLLILLFAGKSDLFNEVANTAFWTLVYGCISFNLCNECNSIVYGITLYFSFKVCPE